MNTKKIQPIQIIFLMLTFVLISCSKESENPLFYSPDGEMPVVTGLFFTSEESPEVLFIWGNPSGNSFCHPTIGISTSISFSVPSETNVKVWVVPARLPQQNSNDVINLLNAHFKNESGLAVAILLDEIKNAGSYSYEYNFLDSEGNLLPEGFYRIYVQSGDWLRWCDVFNFRNESNYYKVIYNQIRNQRKLTWRPQ
jgi:hypothetical protein